MVRAGLEPESTRELFTLPPPDTYPVLGPALLARRAVSTVKDGSSQMAGIGASNRLNEDMARGHPRPG